MIVIVTGSRHWRCDELADQVVMRLIARYGPTFTLRLGGAPGVDAAFECAAREHGIATEVYAARWDDLEAPGAVIRRTRDGRLYNANAGPARNAAMVAAGADLCIAVHRDLWGSKGTLGCVRLALAAGIPVWLVDGDDVRPRRILEA